MQLDVHQLRHFCLKVRIWFLQGPAPYSSSSFNSVKSVPAAVLALKQAVIQQPITVAVDASDWPSYTGVNLLLNTGF